MLERILFDRRRDLDEARARIPLDEVRRRAKDAPAPRDFLAALTSASTRPALIAEVKRASPSRGVLRADLDPPALACAYHQAGAAAISVLTEPRHFRGSLDDLRAVRAAVPLPVLRKDFLLDEYMVWEARAHGADAVLLIVGAVHVARLAGMHALALELGMTPLVEVHQEHEIEIARHLGPRLVGINNRNLETLEIDRETAIRLRPRLPPGVACVAESGLENPTDVARAREAGYTAILVGTALVAGDGPFDPARRVRELMGGAP